MAVQLARTPAFRAAIMGAVTEALTDEFLAYVAVENADLARRLRGTYQLRFDEPSKPSLLHATALWEGGAHSTHHGSKCCAA